MRKTLKSAACLFCRPRTQTESLVRAVTCPFDELDAVLGTRAASSPPVVLESSGTGSSTDQDTGMADVRVHACPIHNVFVVRDKAILPHLVMTAIKWMEVMVILL